MICISLYCQAISFLYLIYPSPISLLPQGNIIDISLLCQAHFIASPANIICISLLCQADFITISFLIITSPGQYHCYFIALPGQFHCFPNKYHLYSKVVALFCSFPNLFELCSKVLLLWRYKVKDSSHQVVVSTF